MVKRTTEIKLSQMAIMCTSQPRAHGKRNAHTSLKIDNAHQRTICEHLEEIRKHTHSQIFISDTKGKSSECTKCSHSKSFGSAYYVSLFCIRFMRAYLNQMRMARASMEHVLIVCCLLVYNHFYYFRFSVVSKHARHDP